MMIALLTNPVWPVKRTNRWCLTWTDSPYRAKLCSTAGHQACRRV